MKNYTRRFHFVYYNKNKNLKKILKKRKYSILIISRIEKINCICCRKNIHYTYIFETCRDKQIYLHSSICILFPQDKVINLIRQLYLFNYSFVVYCQKWHFLLSHLYCQVQSIIKNDRCIS